MEDKKLFEKLWVLELAQNHHGSTETAKEIIKQASKIYEPYKQYGFQFAIKLQYRNLDTFIHPDFKGNHDYKFIKRFEETKLTWAEYKQIKDYAKEKGFITACTPFDEIALQKVIEHDFDIIKIASCSFTDWPLLEEIVKHDKPIIASCGAAELEDIDRIVDFFTHRNKDFALLHCVPEYPTKEENLKWGQVHFLKNRYPNIIIGISSHDTKYVTPFNSINEFHIKLNSKEGNEYSISIHKLKAHLENVLRISGMYGETDKRYTIPQSQKDTIRSLQRGVYAKRAIHLGEKLTKENIYFAMPAQLGQLTANDMSKYKEYELESCNILDKDQAILRLDVEVTDKRQQVLDIVQKLIPIIKESGVVLPDRCEMELSYHYGLERFEETGAALFNIINENGYCKKTIILLPGQEHPEHYHKEKIETFLVIHGDLRVNKFLYKKGFILTMQQNEKHWFSTDTGCIFEEISTMHYSNDSYYTDEKVLKNRKTKLTFYKEWLEKGVK